jgi:hypothetical protein
MEVIKVNSGRRDQTVHHVDLDDKQLRARAGSSREGSWRAGRPPRRPC